MNQTFTHSGHRFRVPFSPEIEGLRAIAVLAVIFYHAGLSWMPGGFVGVDIFFVISGYLISSLLFRDMATSAAKIQLVKFWARRARRLLPQALLVVVTTMVIATFLSPLQFFKSIVWDALSALGYVANYRFSYAMQNYFLLDKPPSPFLHFWSLGVEEQFYIVFPVLLLLLHKLKLPFSFILGFIFALCVLSLFLGFMQINLHQRSVFFQTEYRIWELGVGSLIAGYRPQLQSWQPKQTAVQAILYLGLVLIGVSVFWITRDQKFPVPWAILPVSGSALVIVATTWRGRSVWLSNPVAQWLGRLSYALYLWHWPVFVFGPALLPSQRFSTPIFLVTTVLLAALSYYLIEHPIRTNKRIKRYPGSTVIVSLATIGLAMALVFISPRFTHARQKIPDTQLAAMEAARKDLPDNYQDKCHLGDEVKPPGPCIYGPQTANHTVWLFGDSHAAQWLPAFQDAIRTLSKKGDGLWNVKSLTKSSCPSIETTIWNASYESVYTSCDKWRRLVIADIKSLPPDTRPIIVLANDVDYTDWLYSDKNHAIIPANETQAAYIAGLKSMIVQLKELGVPILLIGDTPKAYSKYWDCILGGSRRCDRRKEDALALMRWQKSFAREMGIQYMDANKQFCPTSICPLFFDNTLIYRDRSHITASYIRTLSPLVSQALDEISEHR